MHRLPIDRESNLVQENYAVVYTPRKQRDRFPENCVEIFDSPAAALEASDSGAHRYPAKVMGPCRSSEGFMLYYLVQWLE